MTAKPLLLVTSLLTAVAACDRAPPPAAPSPAAPAAGEAQGRVEHVDAAQFQALAAAKNGLLLDVRTPGEVARGHLPGASVVDFNAPRFEQKVALMQRNRPVFVYCASGGRSAQAAEVLHGLGFAEVYDLSGGIHAWLAAGLPVERPSGEALPPGQGLEPAAFDALLAGHERVLVAFQTPWCTPCRKMAPVVDALATAWKGRAEVVRVDVDQSEALATREKVQGVPVFAVYVHGKERWRHSGELTREALEAELAK